MTDQWTRIFEASLQTLIATTKDFDLPTLAYTARRMADHAITQSSERERTGAEPVRTAEESAKTKPFKTLEQLYASTQQISGIDVSVFQGNINWKQVAECGRQFAYLKLTEGVTYRDPSFYQNWGAANSFHLRAGVYHFFHPADDPVEQAQWFLGSLPYPLRLKVATLIPVVDIEETGPPGKDEWPRFTPAEGQAALEKFCQAVDAALGVRPMLYCRTEWMEANWPGYVWDGLYWLAQYPPAIPLPGVYPWIPTGWPKNNCKLWQYSSTGSVSGIKGAVDLNRFLGQDLKEITL